ncbi:MAG: hypothetical protein ACO34E_18780 [Limisphaerales bacterium]
MKEAGPKLHSTLVTLLTLLTTPAHAATTNPALAYNSLILAAVRADNTGPTSSTRNLAILHTAIFDAVNSITPAYQPYLTPPIPPPDCSPEAAATSAGHTIMRILYPSLSAQTDALHQQILTSLPNNASTTNGLRHGEIVANLMLQSRQADGSSTQVPYIPSTQPGQWLRTPPFYRPPLDPHWRYVTPFCLETLEPFVAPGPPPLNSEQYAADLLEVQTLGSLHSPTRTPEQEQIAVFWSDFSYTAMPPGHVHEIATSLCLDYQLNLLQSAKLLALLSLTQADAAIVCWEGKYRHNFWRPVTAIQRADEDNNPNTIADPAWTGLLPSPNFPEYPSGHSTFGKAGTYVLTLLLGTDNVPFTATSDSLPGITRSFTSLAACADEIGRSRIYGGFHFESANRDGKASGKKIASFIAANYLLPLNQLPLLRLEPNLPSNLTLRLHGSPGSIYLIEYSSNLTTWFALTETSTQTGGTLIPLQPAKDNLPRFYRAAEIAVP